MSIRQKSIACFSTGLLLSAFLIPYFANPKRYSLVEYFLPYFGSGIPFVILSIMSFIILIKKDLKSEAILRRISGILCPYLFFFYQDFQLHTPDRHHAPTLLGYLFLIILMIPTLYVVGYGVVYILQDYAEHKPEDEQNKNNKYEQ